MSATSAARYAAQSIMGTTNRELYGLESQSRWLSNQRRNTSEDANSWG